LTKEHMFRMKAITAIRFNESQHTFPHEINKEKEIILTPLRILA